MASFSVVAMVREELDVIRRFLDYWSAIGADRIHLFYDGEIPLDTFEDYPNVTLRLADEALWEEIGGKRSDVVAARQQAIFNYLYPAIKSDWLIFPDCDEFVAGTASVLEFLDSVPSEVLSVGLPTAEAVFRREDDEDLAFSPCHFRIVAGAGLLSRILIAALYGRDRRFLRRGLTGHTVGKHFVRTGYDDIKAGAHGAKRQGERVTEMVSDLDGLAGRMWLFHFDAISYPNWKKKWQRRIAKGAPAPSWQAVRQQQWHLFKDAIAAGEAPARDAFRRFYRLSWWQFELARLAGTAFRTELFAADGPIAHGGKMSPGLVSHIPVRRVR